MHNQHIATLAKRYLVSLPAEFPETSCFDVRTSIITLDGGLIGQFCYLLF